MEALVKITSLLLDFVRTDTDFYCVLGHEKTFRLVLRITKFGSFSFLRHSLKIRDDSCFVCI